MCHRGGQRFREMGEERQEMGFSLPPCAGMWALSLSALISTQEIDILIILRQSCEARCFFSWDLYWAVNGVSATSKLKLQNQSRLAKNSSAFLLPQKRILVVDKWTRLFIFIFQTATVITFLFQSFIYGSVVWQKKIPYNYWRQLTASFSINMMKTIHCNIYKTNS